MSDVYGRAIKIFGVAPQMGKCVEEASELSTAICKFLFSGGPVGAVAEELADVEIMCAQMRSIIGDALVDEQKAYKLRRLEILVEHAEDKRRKVVGL